MVVQKTTLEDTKMKFFFIISLCRQIEITSLLPNSFRNMSFDLDLIKDAHSLLQLVIGNSKKDYNSLPDEDQKEGGQKRPRSSSDVNPSDQNYSPLHREGAAPIQFRVVIVDISYFTSKFQLLAALLSALKTPPLEMTSREFNALSAK